MDISFISKETNYTTPEFDKIIDSLTQLKTFIITSGNHLRDKRSYNKLLKNVDDLEESIYNHYKEINKIEQLFLMIATNKLTKKKKEILRWLVEHYTQKTVYTVLIQKISRELEIPKSTVRWNLKGLREADLIRAGDKNNKGIPVSLTPIGRIMADYALMSD